MPKCVHPLYLIEANSSDNQSGSQLDRCFLVLWKEEELLLVNTIFSQEKMAGRRFTTALLIG